MIIPFHALIIAVIRSDAAMQEAVQVFPQHEWLSAAAIRVDLWGDRNRPERDGILTAEVRRRASLKLSLGERVIVDADTMSASDRSALARMAHDGGASVIYVIPSTLDRAKEGELMAGERFADAVVVLPPGKSLCLAQDHHGDPGNLRKSHFKGVTVVGDVHGNLAGLRRAMAWARGRNHFVYLLGDILDYGPSSIAVLNEVHGHIMRGEAAMVVGNHERKIARWLAHRDDEDARPVRLSDGNRTTTDAFKRLDNAQRRRWSGRLGAVLARSSLIAKLDNVTLVHAAVHPSFWRKHPHDDKVEHFALYGEADRPHRWNEPFALSHNWVDAIPSGHIVIVGHDTRAPVPLTIASRSGGTAVFIDTGSGKGGALSSADLRFQQRAQLSLENFNRHE